MRTIKHLALAALALFAVVGCASKQTTVAAPPVAEAIEKPSFSASQTETVTAVIKFIDYDTREVTLIDDMGDELAFIAGDNVRNLRQVSSGTFWLQNTSKLFLSKYCQVTASVRTRLR